jgi:hypothetical protein
MTERLSEPLDCPEKGSRSHSRHSSEVFWPEAILPSVLPETRIFTWGYDADVDAFNTSVGHNNVEQHANDLLVDVANLLEKLGDVSDWRI